MALLDLPRSGPGTRPLPEAGRPSAFPARVRSRSILVPLPATLTRSRHTPPAQSRLRQPKLFRGRTGAQFPRPSRTDAPEASFKGGIGSRQWVIWHFSHDAVLIGRFEPASFKSFL